MALPRLTRNKVIGQLARCRGASCATARRAPGGRVRVASAKARSSGYHGAATQCGAQTIAEASGSSRRKCASRKRRQGGGGKKRREGRDGGLDVEGGFVVVVCIA